MRLVCACRSETGPVRSRNEDRVLCRPEAGIFAVADGMGGWVAGDVAARMVVDALARVPAGPLGEMCRAVRAALEEVNAALLQCSLVHGPSGSTVVVMVAEPPRYRILWAGDSRAGLWRGGHLSWLTTDHNLAGEAVRLGRMDDGTARRSHLASRLTRAVGVDAELELDEVGGTLEAGDRVLLCSDGLTGTLSDAEIGAALAEPDPERAADRLMAMAVVERLASDNVTVALVEARARA